MIKIAICDDELRFSNDIRQLLDQWEEAPAHIQAECFSDGDALIAAHKRKSFDIILLDIVMPVLNGIETAREIREFDKNTKIVFLTSSAEFAIDSYSVKASNYLLKPVEPAQLFSCITDLSEELQAQEKHILIKDASTYHRVLLHTIEYVEAQNKYVKFVLSDGSYIMSSDKLYTCEDKLLPESNFYKCHRSYIINIHHISSYSLKEITMRSGDRIPISRSCQKDFESRYFSVLFGEAGDL